LRTSERMNIFGKIAEKSHKIIKGLQGRTIIKRHGSVSRQVYYICIASRDWTVYLYASPRVASSRDYRISITAELMKF